MGRKNARRKDKPAVGYIRVSTQRQARDGIGLEGQRAAIEKFCEIEGFRITEWYQDAASGMGSDSAVKREGLNRALETARDLRCPLIVNGLDRLSRDTRTLEEMVLNGNVVVISTDASTLTPHAVRSNAARAEAEGRAISKRTKEGLQRKKAAGVKLGNRTNLDQAQKAGSLANKARAAAKVEEIANHLEGLPGRESMSARDIVESLNAAGIRSGRDEPWTVSAVRRPLAAAKEVLRERIASRKLLSEHPHFGRFG